ncbi:hypothetical protein I3842_13G123200 [Carya illinoinensis]|uniref:BED-type domain-containing protein n=1 Tax=Carya illinoinensis TaxID=32201 RepID=A0A922AIT9_CARIL|nr:hypothetical protein I3842_13G123200 [Carya illinoinensis]
MSKTVSNDPYIEGESDDLIELDSLEDISISLQTEQSKAKRRKTSNIWGFFEMVPNSDNSDGKPRAKCKMCGATYLVVSKYGTENLKVHIETCPRRNSRDIGQLMLCQNSGSMLVSASKFAKRYRELWVEAILKHDIPFQSVECSGIRAAFQYLRPDVPLISINTIKADLVKMYHRERKRVKCMLNDVPGRISLTSNLWTSINTDSYMCITTHFLDKNWVLQKRVLNFSIMPPPHNGISLSEKVYNLLCKWGIENKIFILTSDNASSNDVSVEILRTQLNSKKALICDGEFFHLQCCAHILNLVVQDGLKEIDCAIQKVRDSIKYVKGSETRKQKFLYAINQMSLDSKKGLRQDVPTRWDSTFLMLESALFYRRGFCHLELTDSNFKHCLSTSEWDKVEKISTLLAAFYDATCDFSGIKYPTANLYFPAVFMIYLILKRQCESEDDCMRKMSYQMLAKFEKYWSEFNVMLAIAVILDPRYKLQFVEFSYKKLYGNSSQEYLHVRAKLASFFMEYSSGTPTSSASERNVCRDVEEAEFRSFSGMTRIMKEFDSFQTDDLAANMQKNQLELYLDEPRADRNANLDILDFWKGNEFRYPDLANMARDILSVPVSTVASESFFSVDGRIIDQFKSALKPDIIEALVCTRDWLYGDQVESEEMKLDELIEDILEVDINKSKKETPLPLQVL